ncbi:MAG: 23S rRNA (uracil(1939)-C(5))-methyltransferase RlmD [Firmicutes bacterium]|nr:23S rRNA (uracil(1939)-C(5))-methyltransferase RlmD [Bacillota bacterium]
MNFKKNDKCIVDITDLGTNGEGIGKTEGFTIFVNGALPGEKAEVLLMKVKKNYAYGKLVNLIKPSKDRVRPVCSVSGKCGGCSIQHLDYVAQLRYKKSKVLENLRRIGGFDDISVNDVIGMKEPYFYRNKEQYPVRYDSRGGISIGFYAMNSHRVVECAMCHISHDGNEKIINTVRKFMTDNNVRPYDEESGRGSVRHILIRNGVKTNQLMVCLVVNGNDFKYKQQLIKAFEKYENLRSLVINYNNEKTNVILGKKCEVIYGDDHISDYIGSLRFNISPLSFFQVNPVQTEQLYGKALEFAALTGNETVIDAYCGIGTITLFLAQNAKKVYGIEIVPQAIENARKNAEINHIKNAEFFCGKSEDIVPELYEKQGIKPDVMVVDPPRKGCDASLLQLLLKMSPKRIVYVSCDSATLARDLKILCENGEYMVTQVQPVDMFPHSVHIENVCLLEKIV